MLFFGWKYIEFRWDRLCIAIFGSFAPLALKAAKAAKILLKAAKAAKATPQRYPWPRPEINIYAKHLIYSSIVIFTHWT